MKYILIVFDRGVGYPEEIVVLNSITQQDTICAAQCGPINICQFSSDFSKDEISKILREKEIEFLLTDADHADTNLPKKLADHFSRDPEKIHQEVTETKVKKRSLKDLLAEALANEEYEIASGIKKLMDEGKSPS